MKAHIFVSLALFGFVVNVGAQSSQATEHPLLSNPEFVEKLNAQPAALDFVPERSYEFDGQVQISVTQTEDGETSPLTNYSLHWQNDSQRVGVDGSRDFGGQTVKCRVVVDETLGCSFSVLAPNQSAPLGICTSHEANQGIEIRSEISFNRTASTRIIAGAPCEKVTWSIGGKQYTAWMATTEANIPDQLSNLLGQGGRALVDNVPEGQMLELTIENTTRGTSTTYMVTGIDATKQHTIRAQGVDFTTTGLLSQEL